MRTSQHRRPKVRTALHPSSETAQRKRKLDKRDPNTRRKSPSISGELARALFDLVPLTSMAGLIPVMQRLTPLVVAAAAWHLYKLKKLENGSKTVVTAGR